MSNYETKPGQGAIFKNDYKQQSSHPDYRGKGKDLQGNDIEIAMWVKKSKAGKSFFSFQISKPYDKGAKPSGTGMPKSSEFDDNTDGLPF